MKFHGVTYHLKIDPSGVPDKIPSGLYAKLSVPAIVAFAKDAAKDGMQALAETLQLCY